MCVGVGVQAIYITMQGVLLHMYVLCVRNKSPKSLQVVQAQSVCVCGMGVFVCAKIQ